MSPLAPRLADLVRTLENVAKPFRETSTPHTLELVRDARLQIAAHLGEAPTLEREDLAAALAAAFSIQRAVYLTSYTRSAREEQAFQCARAALMDGEGRLRQGAFFAALLLACHPCEVGHVAEAFALPTALSALWLDLSFAQPALMPRTAGADQLASFLTVVCRHLLRVMQAAPKPPPHLTKPFVLSAVFLQCYFAETDLRPLMSARAAVLEDLFARRGHTLDQCIPLAPLRSRPRVGFLIRSLDDSVESAQVAAHIRNLDRAHFEIILFSLKAPQSVIGDICRAAADTVVALPRDADQAVAAIRSFDLDMAVICNNVTAVLNDATVYAAHRLARIQASNLASPVTTGLRNVDFMITGQFNEPPDFSAHYTERLLVLPGSANCYDLPALERRSPRTTSRAAYGIDSAAVVFYSSAAFPKLHPHVVDLWATILARVPGSVLMLMPFGSQWSAERPAAPLTARLREACAAAGVDDHRIIVAPPVAEIADLHAIMGLADVFLDSFPFSTATSVYDALRAGLPIIARAGATSRGLHCAAILREAGLGEWVASSDDAYVALAVKLGSDAAYRTACKARVSAVQAAGLPIVDTVAFGAKLGAGLTALARDWSARVAALCSLTHDELARRIAVAGAARREQWGHAALTQAVALPYLRWQGLPDAAFVDLVYGLDSLDTLDFSAAAPRLIMAGLDARGDIGAVLVRMRDRGYRACVFTLRDERTERATITVDDLPPNGAQVAGSILFFPDTDAVFLPSVLNWLELAGEPGPPLCVDQV